VTPRARRGPLLALALAVAACAPAPVPAPPARAPVVRPPEPVPPAGPPCPRIARIEIDKGDRRLRALCEGGAVVEMIAAVSRRDLAPKRLGGDRRTPEGLYRVVAPARDSRFHRFVPIDYPSAADAERALATGEISRGDRDRILDAHRRGDPPPVDTPLGGEIGLHGEGEDWRGWTEDTDWTLGCVAVRDEQIDFIAARVVPGTPVEIRP
jgi:murein L,D-transpeptidase YafK